MFPRITVAASLALAAATFTCIAGADPAPPVPASSAPPAAPQDDVEVPASPPASAPPAAADPAARAREIEQLRARIEALEAKSPAPPPPPPPPAPAVGITAALVPSFAIVRSDPADTPTTSFDASPWARTWERGLHLGGYVQTQYQNSQLSENQLDANGTPLNQDRLLVRRARLRVDRAWDWAAATFEVDGNNNNGVAFGIRRAEGALLWRAKDPKAPPYLVFSAGLSDIPFGYELFEPNRSRLFLERTTASRAFFPGDNDYQARLAGGAGPFRYAVSVMDGTPVPDSEPASAGFDPTSEKDILGHFGAEAPVNDQVGLGGGVSFIKGTGFHAGTPATKDSFQWRDLNGNGSVDPGETTALPGSAATPSSTFGRWALGFDLQLRVKTPIGRGMLYGEAYVGQNFDRGLFIADPVATGADVREIGWYAAYVQEITPYAVIGLRVDSYNPNADATSQRAGNLLPLDQTITTWSPLVGLVLPYRARLMFEYDRVLDHEGIDSRGVPTDLRNDQWAIRLQVEL